jgi:hypothetical protein
MSTAPVIVVPVYVLYTIWQRCPIMLHPLCIDLRAEFGMPNYGQREAFLGLPKTPHHSFGWNTFSLHLRQGIRSYLVAAYGVV